MDSRRCQSMPDPVPVMRGRDAVSGMSSSNGSLNALPDPWSWCSTLTPSFFLGCSRLFLARPGSSWLFPAVPGYSLTPSHRGTRRRPGPGTCRPGPPPPGR
ncbi:hypothetical protein ACFFX0_28865 [Citricoccus parietis]|uniref:Uncharacterized protein n=1 Tax=Citricoccus parietis TaxID=592307 RepID=A0ABV5G7P9_9MICC